MADIELVIKIPEDVYTRLFDNGIQDNEIAVDDVCEMARVLRLGKPLPKGHGDLIDRDDVLAESHCIDDWSGNEVSIVDVKDVKMVPTIIEKDKEESEE